MNDSAEDRTFATETCASCGADTPTAPGGITHRYLASSAGCWARYGEVLAHEYEHPALMHINPLTVDAYAVQHPGEPEGRGGCRQHAEPGDDQDGGRAREPVERRTLARPRHGRVGGQDGQRGEDRQHVVGALLGHQREGRREAGRRRSPPRV